jgi:hypothetical protein
MIRFRAATFSGILGLPHSGAIIMTPQLSEDQRQAIEECNGAPIDVVDSSTNAKYVLVRKEIFENMRAVVGDCEPEDMYPLLAEVTPEDWEDASNYGIPKS